MSRAASFVLYHAVVRPFPWVLMFLVGYSILLAVAAIATGAVPF